MKERRVKIVRIEEEELLEAFTRTSAPHYVTIRNRELPEGYRVEGVHHDWPRRCFQIVVSHPSFDEVPDGQYIPDLEGPSFWAAEVVKVKRDDGNGHELWDAANKMIIGVDLAQPGGDRSVKFREFT